MDVLLSSPARKNLRCHSFLRGQRLRAVLFLLFAATFTASAAQERRFQLGRDTFAFSNDTAFAYGIDEQGRLRISLREDKPDFSHGCFLMIRACVQFWKFASFVPEAPRISREEYQQRLERLFRIPTWSSTCSKIQFPGFADLEGFSRAYEGLLKENLGNWLATYIRPGNWRLMFGHPRDGQAFVAKWLLDQAKEGQAPAVYLSRFPSMNHAVLVVSAKPELGGDILFKVYDVNYPAKAADLRYVAARKSFDFERRWYFPGGQVNVMRIYLSPLH